MKWDAILAKYEDEGVKPGRLQSAIEAARKVEVISGTYNLSWENPIEHAQRLARILRASNEHDYIRHTCPMRPLVQCPA
jgi:hypothetical protein